MATNSGLNFRLARRTRADTSISGCRGVGTRAICITSRARTSGRYAVCGKGPRRGLPCHRLAYPPRTLGNRQLRPRRRSYCIQMIATERLLILVGNDRINTVSQRSLRPDPTSLLPLHKSGFRQPELTTTPRSMLPPVRSAGSNDRQPPGFVSGAEPTLSSGRPSSCIRMVLYSSSRSAQCRLNSSAWSAGSAGGFSIIRQE